MAECNLSEQARAYLTSFELFLMTQRCASRNTHRAYLRDVRQFLNYGEFGTLSAAPPTTQRIARQVSEVATVRNLCRGFREELWNAGLGARSIARKISALRTFFRYLDDHHPGHVWPEAGAFLGQLPRMERRLPRTCSDADTSRLLKLIPQANNTHEARVQMAILLLYGCGLRVSELSQLKRRDVHLQEEVICVRGKGGKTRLVPLHAVIKDRLMSTYVLLGAATYVLPCGCGEGDEHAWSRQGIWRAVKRAAQEAGLTVPLHPHMLRHAFATTCLELGWNLRALQTVMGHERIATTEMYIHLTTKFVKDEYAKRHPRARRVLKT